MVREGSSPGGSRPASVLAWFVPAAVTAVVAGVATATVPSQASTPVVWIGVVATAAVAVVTGELARRGRVIAELREQDVTQQEVLARQESESVRLSTELLPELVARLGHGEFPEDVLASMGEQLTRHAQEAGLTPEFTAAHEAVLRSMLDAVVAEEDLRDSAQRAFVNIARRVQAIVHQQAQELREMEDRHGHTPDVFGDLLRLDHGTALIGRLADSIAVLGGARPGRQWSRAVPLFSVLRGAMSRIIDYQRVELHSVSEVAVVGPAVEPLIHALAELLDNATRYSPPQTRVHLTAVEVQSGIAVEIEDGGVSMSEEARKRAERMLEQAQQGIDVNDLGETPRLGLAVVGRLAQVYNFQVSLRTSAYGGVRAVLIVPQDLITTAPATGRAHGIGASSGPLTARTEHTTPAPATAGPAQAAPPAAVRPVSAPVPAPAAPAAPVIPREEDIRDDFMDDLPPVTERSATGLPQRRRKTRATAPVASPAPPAAPAPVTASPAPAPDDAPPVQPGMWLAAFQSGLSGESQTSAPAGASGVAGAARESDESSEKSE
ncbi:sensor histidine kinase [Streptomyces pinistramenti]|uniref:sensor histidine kinase n=1 Tax=Streptomyces pinistramenti TaxID=2884812 RepID=UPI001D060C8C|nr:ATP-binding protein [Streptomyces pinistramenti]MCB5908033.1 ATP-binding protein [Streptomyces pinistramenti]